MAVIWTDHASRVNRLDARAVMTTLLGNLLGALCACCSTTPAASSTTPTTRNGSPRHSVRPTVSGNRGRLQLPLPGPMLSSLVLVSDKSQRRAARSVVAEYHHAQLDELVARVGEAVDRYRAGELDAFDVDQVLFQYSRAAKELWKFCNHLQVEVAAAVIREQPSHDWWERGAPRQR